MFRQKDQQKGIRLSIIGFMGDKLLSGVLNLVIVGMITLLAGAALVCAHTGVLRLCAGGRHVGFELLGGAAALSLAAGFLIKNRNDLVDR